MAMALCYPINSISVNSVKLSPKFLLYNPRPKSSQLTDANYKLPSYFYLLKVFLKHLHLCNVGLYYRCKCLYKVFISSFR